MRAVLVAALVLLLSTAAVAWPSWNRVPGGWGRVGPFRLAAALTCPAIPTSSFVYVYDADNIDGASNGTVTDGALIATWVNGGSGGNATNATDSQKPTAQLLALNRRTAVAFDGVADFLTAASSATGLSFVHSTGVFDIFVVMRKDLSTIRYVFANTNTTASLGFGLFTTAANKLTFFVAESGVSNVSYTSTYTVTQGEWASIEFKGDGTTFSTAKNGAAYETTSFLNKPFTVGNATNAFTIGKGGPNDISTQLDGAIALLLIASSELSASDRAAVQAAITCRYAL